MKRLIIIIIVMLGMGMCVSSITYFNATRLTFTAEQFCRLVTIGKIKRSYYYLSDGFQDEILLWDYKQYLEGSPFADYKGINWTFRRKDEETGLLKGILRTQEGRAYNIEMSFKHENKRWKIDSITEDGLNVRHELGLLKEQKERAKVPSN